MTSLFAEIADAFVDAFVVSLFIGAVVVWALLGGALV